MKCLECYGATKVIRTRMSPDKVYRRRKCPACGYRFTTLEVLDLNAILRTAGTEDSTKGTDKETG